LVRIFVEWVPTGRVPPGSVVVCGSATHLADVGISKYARDFVEANRKVFGKFRGEVIFTHGAFIFLGGADDPPLLRATAELLGWLKEAGRDSEMLTATLGKMWGEILKGGVGEQPGYGIRITLPCSTTEFTEKRWVSSGWPYLPNGVNPATPENEDAIVSTMMQEISNKFAIPMSRPAPPSRLSGRGTGEFRFVIVGSSHAIRLAEALKKTGALTVLAAKPGWRISKAAVEDLVKLTSECLDAAGKSAGEDFFIFQLFDNSFHMARSEECTYLPHSKDSNGRYHVFGEAVLAPRDTQFEMFRTCIPILKQAAGKNSVMLAPLPRYLYSSCCEDPEHVAGLDSPNHRGKMRDEVDSARQHLKDFAWSCGIRNAKALNPGRSLMESAALEEEEDRHLWLADPVHPSEDAYGIIAKMIVEHANSIKGNGLKRKGQHDHTESNKKIKMMPPTWRGASYNRDSHLHRPPTRGRGYYGARGLGRPKDSGFQSNGGRAQWRRRAY
jgi:hypothetical protein